MAGWSAAGAIIGGALSGAGSMAAGGMSARAAKNMYKHRYQWATEDAKKAGLNPMLVATQGSPPTPSSPTYENPAAGLGAGIANAPRAYQAAKLNQVQIENVQANTAQAKAAASKTDAEDILLRAKIPFSAESAATEFSIQGKQLQKISNEVDNLAASGQLTRQEFENNKVLQPLMNQIRELERQYREYGLSEAKATSDLWDDLGEGGKLYKELGPAAAALLRIAYKVFVK